MQHYCELAPAAIEANQQPFLYALMYVVLYRRWDKDIILEI
jgi:hypothetical protein